jgi:hypothetical protein
MDIFTKYDQKTWIKDVGYPCIVMGDETGEIVYKGLNPREYFEEFDIQYCQEYFICVYMTKGSWIDVGKICSLDGKLPKFIMDYVME